MLDLLYHCLHLCAPPACVGDTSSPRLNNPPVNALSHHVRRGILEALARAQFDDEISLIVITGGGGQAFSAGADIKEMSGAHFVDRKPDLVELVDAIEACRVPVVAAIGGVALGGGCEVRTTKYTTVFTVSDN